MKTNKIIPEEIKKYDHEGSLAVHWFEDSKGRKQGEFLNYFRNTKQILCRKFKDNKLHGYS